MGFEAIFAGHKPRVFGQPFYAGWGLTEDAIPRPRRQRNLTRAQLFAAAMMLYPTWYDPFRDRLCDLETAIDDAGGQARAWRDDHAAGTPRHAAVETQAAARVLWPPSLSLKMIPPRPATERPRMVWAGKATRTRRRVSRVEDGFLRSRGLGRRTGPAAVAGAGRSRHLLRPDRPSRLGTLIERRASLRPISTPAPKADATLTDAGLSKYNLGGAERPDCPRAAASSCPDRSRTTPRSAPARRYATNRALLEAARAANPDAYLSTNPTPMSRRACARARSPMPATGRCGADPRRPDRALWHMWTRSGP